MYQRPTDLPQGSNDIDAWPLNVCCKYYTSDRVFSDGFFSSLPDARDERRIESCSGLDSGRLDGATLIDGEVFGEVLSCQETRRKRIKDW